jgi:hypothetical protein
MRLVCAVIASCSACSADQRSTAIDGFGGGDVGYLDPCGGTTEEPPAEPNACLFGEVFSDIRSSDALLLTSETWIRSVDELTELAAEQLLIAVQQSSHTDVTTPAEALERVDQQEVRRIDFYELATERWFVVYEYGVGDNSYGAFFESEGTEVVASIHDGDLLNCSVTAAESSE